MRFLADENVSRFVIERLRHHGHDVASIGAAKPGASDEFVLVTAEDEGRILITEDRDFGELIVRQLRRAHGMILLELDRFSSVVEADRVAEIVSVHADKLSGNLFVIEPARVRIRPLQR